MLKSVCVLFAVLLVAPLASAEVFKCVGKYGEALYQNFPCQFASMGGTAMDAPGPKELPAEVSGPKESPANVSGAKKSPAASAEPRAGMPGSKDDTFGVPLWRQAQSMVIVDWKNPHAAPIYIRTFGLVGGQPGSTGPMATSLHDRCLVYAAVRGGGIRFQET